MTKILGIGNALLDSEFVLTDLQLQATGLTKGNMTLASHSEQAELIAALNTQNIAPSKQASGGSAANSIFAAASLGSDTAYICRVGDDAAGGFYLSDLQAGGVSTLPTAMATGETTGSCMVLVTPEGERTMQTFLGTSAELDTSNIDFSHGVLASFGAQDWLYIEGYLAFNPAAQTAITQLKQFARDKGMKIAVSFADPAVVKFGREGIAHMLDGGVDAIFCNCEEAMIFTGQPCHKTASQALLGFAALAVVTNGGAGSLIAMADNVSRETKLIEVPTPVIDHVLDTNGAGDNFAGAFLYALSQGHEPAMCGKLASAVAGAVISQFGARLAAKDYQRIYQNL
ncbi:MAG: adenosine kinase [Moraxella sp.]|jgi:ribokinase